MKRVLSDDIELNPGPGFFSCLRTVKGDFHQGNVSLFGNNSGKQCVAMSLTAIVHNTAVQSCYAWRSVDITYILRTGDWLYTVIHGLIGKDYLLLTDVPTCLSINESTYILQYSDCISGDIRMSEARECYLPLNYPACLLTMKSNAVAVFYGNNAGSFKYFHSHSRDVYGNVHGNGTSVINQFIKPLNFTARFTFELKLS